MTVTTTDRRMNCHGANHRDVGVVSTCDTCGMTVVKGHKNQILTLIPRGMGHVFYCWNTHECNEQFTAWKAMNDKRTVAEGGFVKGMSVTVVKGRKVPVGTTGVIRWMGESDFGARVGMAVEGTDGLVYTAVTNVAAADQDFVDAAKADVAAYDAQVAAWATEEAALNAELAEMETTGKALFEELLAGRAEHGDDWATAMYDEKISPMHKRQSEIHQAIAEIKEVRGY